jgi:uncharacterized protein YndB with AHSA1/START domain
VRIEDEIRVDAPVSCVWEAIKNPAVHAQWHPFVTRIGGEHRLGQVRTCEVTVGKKNGQTTERCIEDDQERSIVWAIQHDTTGFSRMVSDWRAGFAMRRRDDATWVTAQSTFVPNNILIKAISPLIKRKFHQTQLAILAALKASAETTTRDPPA